MPDRSVSANVDGETVDKFDAAWQAVWDVWYPGRRYSRSQAIEQAMRIATVVIEAWLDTADEFPDRPGYLRAATDDAIRKRDDYHDLTADR